MENEYLNQNKLTSQTSSPRLEGGDIFMVDAGGEEGRAPQPDAPGAEGPVPPRPPEAAAGAGGEGTPPPPETPPPLETPPPGDEGGEDGGGGGRREYTREDFQRAYDANKEEFKRAFIIPIIPSSSSLDPVLVEFIIGLDDDSLLNYLVNRIISLPLRNENSNYQLGLYSQQNLEHIRSELRKNAEATRGSEKAVKMAAREKRINTLVETAELFHTMNKYIITGNLDDFGRQAPLITPEQQQVLKNVKGVATIMRLIDNEYLRILVEKDTISTEESDKLHGKLSGPEDSLERAVGTVQQQLIDLMGGMGTEPGGVPFAGSTLKELAGLEEWEIDWAFDAGKLLQNIGLRSAELISLSTVPGGDRAWSSIPQEHAARIMNQIGWNMKRFKMGEAKGGLEFVTSAQKHFQELRKRQGYGETGLSKIAGKDIDDFEIASMFKAAGIYTSWRNTNMIIDKMRMVTPTSLPERLGAERRTVGDYIKAVKAARDARIRDELERDGGFGRDGDPKFKKELEKRKTLDEPRRLAETYLENGDLRKEFASGYGILARSRDLEPDQKDVQIKGLLEAKAEIRAAIWRRAAVENPMGVANLMVGMDFKRGQEPHFHHGGIDQFRTFNQSLKTENNPTWKSLRNKLIAVNELRLNSIKAGTPMELESIWGTGEGHVEITVDERNLLGEIQAYGKDIAENMAAVRLPFNPFMNDVIFEDIDYAALGSSYYMRKTGDLGATMQCYENMQKIVMDPSRISREDAYKAMQAMVDAMAAPNSTATAQDEVLPFLMSMLDMWEAGGQVDNKAVRFLLKDNFYKMIAHSITRTPNSIVQKYGGVDAIAYDEFDMQDAINQALHMGITRTGSVMGEDGFVKFVDIDGLLKKKYRAGLLWIIFAAFRDIVPVFALAAVVEGTRQSAKEVKS